MKKVGLAMTVCLVLLACIANVANAMYQVKVTWQLKNGQMDFVGNGDTEAAAIEKARLNCQLSQQFTEWKLYCMTSPLRIITDILPDGTYHKTCRNCRLEKSPEGKSLLVCDSCRPVIERRQLDLTQCPGDAANHIENCHGELICSACPSKEDAPCEIK